MPTTSLWFHCFAGIAGDMALGSLIDAGADLAEVQALLHRLPMKGWSLDVEAVQRSGVMATKVHVGAFDEVTHRTYPDIMSLISAAELPARVFKRARATFDVLAESEGRLHGRPKERVHFHEVGGIDAIVDIVGTCAALEVLGVDKVFASSVAVGLGTIKAAHGVLPNPAPAVIDLLKGASVQGRSISAELTTPTGAALLAAMAEGYGALPAMEIISSGLGAGSRELENLPNVTQAVIGTMGMAQMAEGQAVMLLEANVDDASGEILGYTIARLLEVGAHDAWATPIVMKKGRPAFTITALADIAVAHQVGEAMRLETGSFGMRGFRMERWPSNRTEGQVNLDGHSIRIKVGDHRGKAEFEDAARMARQTSQPVRSVIARAEQSWRRSAGAVEDMGGDEGAKGGLA